MDDCLQYNWTLSTEASSEVNAIFALAKSRLPTAIETKLATFPSAIVDAHGKDLRISADASRTGTPAPASTPPSGPAVAATSQTATSVKRKADTVKVNSTTVIVEAEFHAAADDLFSLLTDEKRIPVWTRAPAQVCRFFFREAFTVKADSEYLFSHNLSLVRNIRSLVAASGENISH